MEGAFGKKKKPLPFLEEPSVSYSWDAGYIVHGARQRANTRVKAPPPNKEKRYFLMPHRLQSDRAIISLLRHSHKTKAFT